MASRLEQIIDDYQTSPALVAISYAIGRRALKENNDYPRIIWVPENGTIGPTESIGGHYTAGATDTRSRQIYTQEQPCTVFLWGEDFEAAENMLHNFVAAGWAANVGSISFGAYSWQTQHPNMADYLARGEMVALQVSIQIPIIENTDDLTEILTEDHTAKFVSSVTGAETTTHSP